MPRKHVLFWFDVEDCTVTHSDDAAKRIAQILTSHGVRGTMKVVGQKARMLRERVRYSVTDALSQHAIGYHSNWHGLRPQPAEYMAPFDWLEGGAEFERREAAGIDDLRDVWGQDPVCYGQPGSNWSPQVFPILRKWGIPTYVSGYGYVGLFAQPFYYGGMINTSHMWGKDRRGRQVRHMFGLNFELGEPGALDEHLTQFAASYDALEDGGLISIMNHPCTLVMEEWFSTNLKPRDLTEAGYEHFDSFVGHVVSRPDVETITADQLPDLYPDLARDRVFSADELLALARAVGEQVNFQEAEGMSLSPAELFGMFTRFLAHAIREGSAPAGAVCLHLDGPATAGAGASSDGQAGRSDFSASVLQVEAWLRSTERLPSAVSVGDHALRLDAYHIALARALIHLIETRALPSDVDFAPADNQVDQHVDEAGARSGWAGSMLPDGFEAPK
ncbi:MAG TPA: hypothetical protein QGH10_10070, partial [Armatimonadota bacterium]|nr:hypothetical protein [Armatimonadota bacterium]